jgi:hypothetical protein
MLNDRNSVEEERLIWLDYDHKISIVSYIISLLHYVYGWPDKS